MSGMKDLLGDTPYSSRYPDSPGSKEKGGTSQEAAARMAPIIKNLKKLCLDEIERQSGTSDEIAKRLGKSVLSIRPRITELIALGLVRKAQGERRCNVSGMTANVIEAVPQISWQG